MFCPLYTGSNIQLASLHAVLGSFHGDQAFQLLLVILLENLLIFFCDPWSPVPTSGLQVETVHKTVPLTTTVSVLLLRNG